jgi:hypothetical protein
MRSRLHVFVLARVRAGTGSSVRVRLYVFVLARVPAGMRSRLYVWRLACVSCPAVLWPTPVQARIRISGSVV